jgi:ADP-ribose pyrophosphatase YjhB (NUDIX family)
MSIFSSKSVRLRVAGLVVKDGKLLLISHNKDGRDYWLVPGGGVDFGETAADALKREMSEELSIIVEAKDLVFTSDSIDPSGKRHIFNLFFSCEIKGGNFALGDDPRLSGYRFFSAKELSGITIFPPYSKQLIAYLSGISQSVYLGSVWEE